MKEERILDGVAKALENALYETFEKYWGWSNEKEEKKKLGKFANLLNKYWDTCCKNEEDEYRLYNKIKYNLLTGRELGQMSKATGIPKDVLKKTLGDLSALLLLSHGL